MQIDWPPTQVIKLLVMVKASCIVTIHTAFRYRYSVLVVSHITTLLIIEGRLLEIGHEPAKHLRVCQQKEKWTFLVDEKGVITVTEHIIEIQEHLSYMEQDNINNGQQLTLLQ